MRILIVDDEPLARARLKALLTGIEGAECVGEAANGREAVEKSRALGAEVVLLDIRMPEMDGLEAARLLLQQHPRPTVIFCTAHEEHAVAAFEAEAVDYLLKPVRRERLIEALRRARRSLDRRTLDTVERALGGESGRRSHLCARLRGELKLIPIDEVAYLHAEDKYVLAVHVKGSDLLDESLRQLEKEFGDRFVRIHRNCLVARSRIRGLRRLANGGMGIELAGVDRLLEVSRRCLPAVRALVESL